MMFCALCRFNLSFLCEENENSLRKQLSHVYYLLEGKNPFWNVKCDSQEQILERAKKSWQTYGHIICS